MKYIFRGGNEFIKLDVDRVNKKFSIATSKTNYRFIPQPFWKLFGNKRNDIEESKKEMEEMESLNDEEFEKKLIDDLRKQGYELKKKLK